MAINDDLTSAANLCAKSADAATNKLIALGPRPVDPAAAATWDAQDTMLKNKISILNNLSTSISAVIVSNAMQNVWPNLDSLAAVTASAQANIAAIANITKAMAAIATVINFGVALVTLASEPTPGNAANVLTSLTNLTATL